MKNQITRWLLKTAPTCCILVKMICLCEISFTNPIFCFHFHSFGVYFSAYAAWHDFILIVCNVHLKWFYKI